MILTFRPDIDNAVIPFFVGDQTATVLVRYNTDFLIGITQDFLLLLRHDNVRHRDTYTRTSRVSKTGLLDSVQYDGGFRRMVDFEAAADNFAEVFLADTAC
ncbi:hypothetical protein D3C81_1065240 [compost metagenome]